MAFHIQKPILETQDYYKEHKDSMLYQYLYNIFQKINSMRLMQVKILFAGLDLDFSNFFCQKLDMNGLHNIWIPISCHIFYIILLLRLNSPGNPLCVSRFLFFTITIHFSSLICKGCQLVSSSNKSFLPEEKSLI